MKGFLFFLLFNPFFLFAQDVGMSHVRLQPVSVLLKSTSAGVLDISQALVILKETGKHYSFEEIATGHFDSLFSTGVEVNVNNSEKYCDVWAKASIQSDIDQNTLWILKTDKLYSNVTAYIVHRNGKVEIQKSGWSVPPAKRSVADPDVVFNLSLRERENVTVWLHIHTDLQWSAISKVKVHIIPEAHWNTWKLKNYNFLSVYAGICLLATFYWLITYMFSLRVNYLYLILATLSALFFCLDIYGITSVLWARDPWYMLVKYGAHYIWFPLMVLSHFAISYKANSFVSHFPKATIYCYWGFCVTTVAFLMASPFFMQWSYSHTISLVMVLTCMVFGVVLINFLLMKRGFGSTGFAFLAILPVFIGVGAYIFSSFGFISDQYEIMVPIGALLTVIMYFYGMVHYVRVLRDKRQKEILKNDLLIREQNVILEKTVEERTLELKVANEDLSKAMLDLKETHGQLMEAERLKGNEMINILLKEQELRSVSNMLDVQENERKRIASDLHDRLGSMLSTVKLYFGSVEEHINKEQGQSREQYNKATSLLDEACQEVRRISHDLVSGELVKFGLVSALRQLGKTIEDTGQLKIHVLAFGMDDRLNSSVEIALYRVIQELMNNMLKHAKASEVTIQLNKVSNNLNIVVEDNGIGFDIAVALLLEGMGLKNMETRVIKLNGRIQFDSGKGRGTTTIIDIPV